MKTNFVLLTRAFAALFVVFSYLSIYAQYYPFTYYVIDNGMRSYFNTYYPSCMDSTGTYLNPNCPSILNETTFSNLGFYDCIMDYGELYLFPNLQEIYITNTYYCTTGPQVITVNNLNNLKKLYIEGYVTGISSLSPLPPNLEEFYCTGCVNNQFTSLPSGLKIFEYNSPSTSYTPPAGYVLDYLPPLPNTLETLKISYSRLTSLPTLPNSLKELHINYNVLPIALPSLPNSLIDLQLINSEVTNLSVLPPNLLELRIVGDLLSNPISTLPSLPNSLQILDCRYNNLTYLPNLPSTLVGLWCNNNNISCFPIFPYGLSSLNISANPFTCLPNYVSAMDSTTLNFPLCDVGNANGCPIVTNALIGNVLKDDNSNCNIDYSNDIFTKYVPVKLFDNSTFNQIAQTATAINGIYTFVDSLPSGSYLIEIDTLNKPYQVSCAGYGTTLPINYLLNSQIDSLDFLVNCKPGFDVGIQSVVSQGWVFPGQTHLVNVVAGDISQFYNLNCADGISGQLNINITGPVTYAGVPAGTTFTPVVNGNNLTYTSTNWATIDILNDIKFLLETDTSAQAGDLICINLSITPTSGDNVLSNNTYQFCYYVVNSYDPNRKDVYPEKVEYGYQDWITYTVYFQNTGNAPAFNIKLVDTLSTLLDHKTFELLSYSHNHRYDIKNGVLRFYFDHIMLPDSTTDPMGSIGFVQFRIKPQQAFDYNTIIENQVAIYFDYNSPILTNVAQTSTIQHASIEQHFIDNILIYPNPAEDFITIVTGVVQVNYNLTIYDLSGRLVGAYKNLSGNQIMPLNDEWSGTYILKIHYDNGVENFRKLIIK